MTNFRENRGPERQATILDDIEPAREIINFENSIQWERDPHLEARGNRMASKARDLKCERPFKVMVSMMEAMDLATHPGYIYKGPSEKNIQETKKIYVGDLNRNEIIEKAWRSTQEQYNTLDLPNLPKGSDWARAISVFHAAIQPGEGINGVLDVIAPESGQRGDNHWQKFFSWCNNLRLDAYNLWEVAQELKKGGIKPGQRDELKTELEKLTAAQLDQIILAGFNETDDLKIWNRNDDYTKSGYKTLAGSQRDLDPIKQKMAEDAAYTIAERAREEHLIKNGFLKNGNKWIQPPRGRKITANEIWRESWDIHERILEEEYKKIEGANEQAIQIMPASSAFGQAPAACIIAREGRIENKKIGFGFHPVSPEMVAMLVGPEQLHVLPTELRFSPETGGIVASTKKALTSAEGVVLTKNTEKIKNEEAVKLFAKELVEKSYWNKNDKLRDELKFVFANEQLISEENADQWAARSQGRLQMNFDLENWYYHKLLALGNITTITEAQAHTQDLTLKIEDIFPDQKEIIAEVERDYPTTITLGEVEFPINYRYVSEKEMDPRPAEFSAIISIPEKTTNEKKAKEIKAILELSSDTAPSVGNADKSLPLKFNIRDNWGIKGFDDTNLAETQKVLDKKDRTEAWEKYPDKDRRWKKIISIEDSLPSADEAVTETLEPYYICKNGEPLYPTPALMTVREKDGEYYALYGLYRTSKEGEDDTKRARADHRRNQEKNKRLQAITPEQRNTTLGKIAELTATIKSTDPDNIYLKLKLGYQITNETRLISGLERAEHNLEAGYLAEAKKEITEVNTKYNEEILLPWQLFKEADDLQKILETKTNRLAYKYKHYFKPERLARTDKGLLTKDELEEIVKEMKEAIGK